MSRLAIGAFVSGLVWTLTVAGAAQESGSREPAAQDWRAQLPPAEGKDLVAKQCATCHTLEGVVKLRATKQAWEAVVFDMVARGAPLMIDEVDPIVAYLAAVFGPTAPPLLDANTATASELLKLPGITPALAARLIEHRQSKGPFSSPDALRTVLGMDEAAFTKIKWYVRAQAPGATPARR